MEVWRGTTPEDREKLALKEGKMNIVQYDEEKLVMEIKEIVTESIFASRWALVEGYWSVGQRVRIDIPQEHQRNMNGSYLQDLANKCAIGQRTLYYCLQVYDQYPDIQQLPEGKNISWNKLITKYLPKNNDLPEDDSLPKQLKEKQATQTLEDLCAQCLASGSGYINIEFNGEKFRLSHIVEKVVSTDGALINELIGLFEPINPSFIQLYKIGVQRSAMKRLVDTHGEVFMRNILGILPGIVGQKYAPVITNPVQLENKFGELQLFAQKQKGDNGGIVTKIR